MASNKQDEEQNSKLLTRTRELFHGRFSRQELEQAFNLHQWKQEETISFLLEKDPAEVRRLLNTDREGRIKKIQSDVNLATNARKKKIPTQRRQFACFDCDNVWWQRVPARKMVSRCNRCRQKFDPVPREDEWGWAEYECENCGNQFSGFGQMNRTTSQCYQCSNPSVFPKAIRPPDKKRQGNRRTNNQHSCGGCSGGGGGPCVHPEKISKRVIVPSSLHVSSGSTVNSILSQDLSSSSDRTRPSRPPSVGTILENDEEEGESGNDTDVLYSRE